MILIVDCGTTNLRVTALDGVSGRVLAVSKAPGGVKHTAEDGHNGRLKTALKQCVRAVLEETGASEKEVDACVAYGMITSNVGLLEIPHLIAPAGADQLRAGMVTARFPDIASFEITFIPGVRNFAGPVDESNVSRMDMMRGEETEAVGLYHLLSLKDSAVFVLPGSHNKFVRMDGQGRITGCMTSISGETLDAITNHTVIRDAVGGEFCDAQSYDRDAALAGARECASCGLGRAAFAARIMRTLGNTDMGKIRSMLLGAVLYEDYRALRAFIGDDGENVIHIAGKEPLSRAFCDILTAYGLDARIVDAAVWERMGRAGALRVYAGK